MQRLRKGSVGAPERVRRGPIGHSILNRTCKTDIGRLCSDFGGGHKGAGACALDPASADGKLKEIIQRLRE
jgi:nanoRNase/pAp phosphatase (c-di-AMP/oligoRNAs hydrolase)